MSNRMVATWTLAAAIASLAAGCGKKDDGRDNESAKNSIAEGSKKGGAKEGGANTPDGPNGKSGGEPSKPPEPEMPKVLMTAEHEASCKIKVGDAMPAASLVDLEGKTHESTALPGNKLTVVLFWTAGDNAVSQLESLQFDVAEKFADQGVGAAAIAEGTAVDDAKKAAAAAKARYPILHDADGALWQQVAAAAPPRVYLLDANGKVLWFDLEFSRVSVKTLCQAIEFSLANEK